MEIVINRAGEILGPYSEAEVKQMVEAGTIALTDLGRHAGISDWMPVGVLVAPAEAEPDQPPELPSPNTRRAHDTNLAGRGARLGAVLIDILAGTVSLLPGYVVLRIWSDETTDTVGIILCIAGFGALLALQLVWLTTRGQTIGKRILGVRIVKNSDGSKAGFLHAVVYRAITPALIANIPIVGPFFWLVDSCFIFSQDRRCVHDLIASTRVVKASND